MHRTFLMKVNGYCTCTYEQQSMFDDCNVTLKCTAHYLSVINKCRTHNKTWHRWLQKYGSWPEVGRGDGGDHAADVDRGVEHREVGRHVLGLLRHLLTHCVSHLHNNTHPPTNQYWTISKVTFAHFELIGPEGDDAGFDTARAETDHRNTDEGNRPEVSINHHSFEVFF